MDVLTGRRAAERRALRDRLTLEADLAVDQVKAEADALKKKRATFEGLVEELKERRRGNNA
ncbi:MAG: hypothetical protein ACU0DH_15730 [Paracoccus sp. (in: a-proteobacteria)]|uniref:hypothetical protein n=1 Tax=Paracoccus sp. TaxID=267 RepID=UPI004058DF48